MKSVTIALIGAGGMANSVHYPSLAECDDVTLVGLCDVVPSKLHATAERFEIAHTFTDYREMLEKTSPDAVYILMPPQHLFPLVIHCLSQGHHVFIEKPPGVTLHQTQEMARAAEKHGCKTMVGFNRRFIPLLQQVKAKVEAHGSIIQCMATFHKNSPSALYYDGIIDVLTCDAIHAVDTLRWLGGGEVKAVASDINCFDSDARIASTRLSSSRAARPGISAPIGQSEAASTPLRCMRAGFPPISIPMPAAAQRFTPANASLK